MTKTTLLLMLGGLLLIAVLIAIFPLRRASFRLQAFTVLVLLAGGIGGYLQWGAMAQWLGYINQQAMMKSFKGPEDLIHKLTTHLKKDPQSARGWYLLGRLYASQGQWTEANQAFLKAYELEPDNEQVIINYAQSLWQLNQQVLTPESRALFLSILKKNPKQPDALSMMAIDAYQQQDYQMAIGYWSVLLKLMPKGGVEAEAIQEGILSAQNRMKQ